MKKTTQWIGGTLLFSCVVYALSPGLSVLFSGADFWEWRLQLLFFSGVVALALMALAMLISVRPAWVDSAMGGLDKAYVVHKWAGIWATVAAVLHWLVEHLPKFRVRRGLLAPPPSADEGLSPFVRGLVESGLHFADQAFYLMLVLVLIALLRKIPYRFFRYTHKIFPVVFLVSAWHGVTVQLKAQWLFSPSGYFVIFIAVAGSIPAFISLFQCIGKARKVKAVVVRLERHGDRLVDIHLQTKSKTFSHAAGQFAFVRFGHKQEPHPFTLASAGEEGRLRFVIKALGDHTRKLVKNLQPGEQAEVEGPYGQFHFESNKTRQVWVAGGIGITPFMARLEALAKGEEPSSPVDFWYCTATEEEAAFPADLESLCQKSGVKLHRMVAQKGQLLSAQAIQTELGSLEETSVWFCGPRGFAKCLLLGLKKQGFDERAFHCEAFEMR